MERFAVCGGVAGAKINLLLDVVGRRSDGYHRIDGVMQTVTFGDDLTVTLDREGEGLRVRIPEDAGIPADRTNLVWRAAEAFLSRRSLSGGITVTLTKRIPVAGGLAGGSTDAAGVLRLLNRIAGADALSPEELLAVAQTLGADVPFCLLRPGGAMRTQGIGEVLTPVPALPDCAIVIAKSGEGVSTPWGYGQLDALYGDFSDRQTETARRVEAMLSALQAGDLDRIAAACYNIFEEAVISVRPRVRELKDRMLETGAKVAMMSGSGPSVFGIFTDREAAARLVSRLCRTGVQAFLTEPARTE